MVIKMKSLMISRIFLLLLGGCSISTSSSFVVRNSPIAMGTRNENRRLTPLRFAQDDEACFKFSASFDFSTKPVDFSKFDEHERVQMEEFFQHEDHKDDLFTGTGNMRRCAIDADAPIPLLLDRWNKESSYFNKVDIAMVEKRCKVIKLIVTTNFLVFQIQAIAALGEQLVNKEGVPEYQFVLLAESFEAAGGPPPLIWLFNQLTRKGQRDIYASSSLEEPHMIHAYLKVYPVIQSSARGRMEVKLCADTHATIVISFPSILLKLVPVPKELIERQGSKALQQNMERDVVPGIRVLREAFVCWMRDRGCL